MLSLPIWISGLLFALIHSVFAAESCKQWFYQCGMTPQHYRLLYSIFALLLTAVWMFYIYQLPDASLYQTDGWPSGVMIAVQLFGAWVVVLSLQSFDTALFLGIKPMTEHKEPFHEHGIYRHIRHPMYSGFMLILFASP
ncbi:NnrU family protein, partial [Pseudomonadota bacterium]